MLDYLEQDNSHGKCQSHLQKNQQNLILLALSLGILMCFQFYES